MKYVYPLAHCNRVYCAGPLFNAAERREMEHLAAALREGGFETFVPHADGLEFAQVCPWLIEEGYDPQDAGRLLHAAVFALDVYQVLVGCGSLLLNLNGRVPDEGAVAEAAMAWAWGKPVVIYKDDCRSKVQGRDNPLVVGLTGFRVVEQRSALAQELRTLLEGRDSTVRWPCPPHLAGPLSQGAQLWTRLAALGPGRPNPQVAEAVMSVFGAPERGASGRTAKGRKSSTQHRAGRSP